MRLSIPLSCCILLFVSTSVADAQHGCCETCDCEPRIKFLDDVCGFFGGWEATSDRDPFEERIETERHDFTQSTKTVGRGVTQLEAGYSFYYKDEDDEIEETHATPEMLLRIGLSDDIEFRIRWNYAWRLIDDAKDADSAQDMIWSIKLGVTDQECWLPESALEIRSSVPTGGIDWTTDRVEVGLDYVYGWKVAEDLTLYGSTGFGTNGLGDFSLLPDEPAADRFIVWSQSVALGAELAERSTLYAEYFGLFSYALEEDFSLNFFNIGVDYYVNNDFVLDLRTGVGLSPDSEDFFGGIGGGYRF